jgi:hypothetical protein
VLEREAGLRAGDKPSRRSNSLIGEFMHQPFVPQLTSSQQIVLNSILRREKLRERDIKNNSEAVTPAKIRELADEAHEIRRSIGTHINNLEKIMHLVKQENRNDSN